MVEAYKEKAEEEFVKCCGDTIFKIMDNEVRSFQLALCVFNLMFILEGGQACTRFKDQVRVYRL